MLPAVQPGVPSGVSDMNNPPSSTDANADAIARIDHATLMHPFSSLHTSAQKEVIVVTGARGATITDARGRDFLDAAAGVWSVNIGHGRKEIAEAAALQMAKVSFFHSFANFTNEPIAKLSERVLALAPVNMSRVLYANSGSEANDGQIKLVRRYNNILGRPNKKKIIARLSSYHGSTVAAASLTGIDLVHRTFDLPIPGILHTLSTDFHRRPANIVSAADFCRHLVNELERLIIAEGPETVAAFIAEPITGAGGVLVPPPGYFREVQKVLRKYDVLMIADEVITGFGRTGAWFASPELGVEPDLMTIAKGLTSSYFPMSATLISKSISDVLYSEREADGAFTHGFTTSGHPVGAAVALANIDILEREALPQNAKVVGEYLISSLRERFKNHPHVGEIRGRGLLIGIELDQDRATRRPFDDPIRAGALLGEACIQERLLVRGAHGRVFAAFAPPLTLSKSEADEIVNRFERATARFTASLRS